MKIASLTTNKDDKDLSFKGVKTPKVDDLKALKRFVNCGLDNLENNLLNKIDKQAPEIIQDVGGLKFVQNDTISRKFLNGIKTFFSMPIDVLDSIASRFPNSKLYNSNFLQKHRNANLLDDEIRALQGIQENGFKFIEEAMPKGGKYPTGECGDYCHSICDPVTKKFNKLLNDTMEESNSTYDTKKERFSARIISGLTAALFLGSDFFNKSIQKGKSFDEAKKEQHLKQGQEVKENICEGITQFAVFACFSKFVNSKVWASALIGAGIGLVSRVISRMSSGMPLGRIEVPENNNKKQSYDIPTVKEFINSIKEGKSLDNLITPKTTESIKQDDKNKKKKEPVLSLKNILLFCAASIAGGYGLRFLGKHTSIGKNISEYFANRAKKFNEKVVEEVWTNATDISKLKSVLQDSNELKLSKDVINLLDVIAPDSDKLLLGTQYKKTKLFGKVEVKTKDLERLKTAPFRFIKELVSYPYKIATKLEDAIRNASMKAKDIKPPEKPKLITDVYDIKNLFLRFKEFEAKSGGDDEKLVKEFGEYVHKMRLASNNNITSSKNDNSKIAVIAQTLGTLTGIGFNMNDEFNSSARNGDTKEGAEKDARLRGINKFLRMTVQIIISGSLNDIFAKQYNNSIAKAGIIVAVSTILTDMASRFLSGMPVRKMDKQELEKYQKDHNEGVMKNYYKAVDWLAS